MKESGCVLLGQYTEQNRIILVIARGKVFPDSLSSGCLEMNAEEEEDVSKYQLKGKLKSNHLVQGIFKHNHDMLQYKQLYSEEENITQR